MTIIDGVYHLQLTPDAAITMQQFGVPLSALGHGWYYHSLCVIFSPIILFELQHASGERATWFFDSAATFIGNSVDSVPALQRSVLVQKATPVLRNLVSAVFGEGSHPDQAEIDAFFGISENARRQIAAACLDLLAPPPIMKVVGDLPETMLALPKGWAHPPTLIRRQYLTQALEENLQDRLIKAALEGQLTWPGVVDGTPQPSAGSLCLNFFAFAFQIKEPSSGLSYYILAAEHNTRLLGLYFPTEGLIVTPEESSRHSITVAFPDLTRMVMDYVCQFGDTLLPYLARGGPKQMAATLREDHLGHHLWNELSGLDRLAANVPAEHLPAILPIDGPTNAFFGPIEALFPEFTGKSRIDLMTGRAIIDFVYRNDLALARFTNNFISSDLRDRIVHHMQKNDDFLAALARRDRHTGPIILIGLRVENRTVINLAAFVTHLVTHIASILPGALIVLDGQNSNDPDTGKQATTSFLAWKAVRSPLEAELEICQQVVAALADTDIAVEIASGKPLSTSIAWSELADCVISFWGAGLAKYRWVANAPTLAITNNDNLHHRGDLLIYSQSRYMANPTEVLFVDPTAVHDDLDAPQIIPLKDPSYANFNVDEGLFFQQVSEFIARHR